MGNDRQRHLSLETSEKSLPVFVGSHETQGFINEIIKSSRNRREIKNEKKKWWFW